MLCRGGAPGGVAGSSNEVCGVKRARPSHQHEAVGELLAVIDGVGDLRGHGGR